MAVQLDHNILNDPDWIDRSAGAFLLWLAGMCYCDRVLTDGFIPASMLPRLAVDGKTKVSCLQELIQNGIWVPVEGGGWMVHNYLKYQNSRETVETQKANNRNRQKNYRDRQKQEKEALRNGVTNSDNNALRNASRSHLVTTPNTNAKQSNAIESPLYPPRPGSMSMETAREGICQQIDSLVSNGGESHGS